MAEYKIAERFVSINGEGPKAGQLAVFLRFCGCNLNCDYCDTFWANQKGTPFTIYNEEQLYHYVRESCVENVTITGGEPLMQPDILMLLKCFSQDYSLNIEIETNGSMPIREIQRLSNPPSFTVDYKLPSCGMESYMLLENFEYLQKKDTVKFVAGSFEDLERAKQIIEIYGLTKHCNVFLSPVFGRIKPESIVEFMKMNILNGVNMQLQLHKYIWSPEERGV